MKMIRLSWKVEQQHTETWTPEEFAKLIDDASRGEVDGTDLDAAYNWLESGNYRAETFLQDIARDKNWLDHGDAEPTDLVEEDEP